MHHARPSAAFVDSIRVNTHANTRDQSWGDLDAWVPCLEELRVRRIRDGVTVNNPGLHQGVGGPEYVEPLKEFCGAKRSTTVHPAL